MRPAALLPLMLSLVSLAASSPLAVPEAAPEAEASQLEKRGYGLYVCDKPNWTGNCKHYWPQYNTCQHYLTSVAPLTGLGSFGPDEGLSFRFLLLEGGKLM